MGAASALLLLLAAAPPADAIKVFLASSCNKFPHPTPCGTDSNDGLSKDAPLETAHKAQELLRASSDDEKHAEFSAGVYELNATLELTAADSGTVWTAADDANVTLSGGEAFLKRLMTTKSSALKVVGNGCGVGQ